MTDVTSLELSKELFELSEWGFTSQSYQDTGTEQFDVYQAVGEYFNSKASGSTGYPAYDAGYLIRKLPSAINFAYLTLSYNRDPVGWQVGYFPEALSRRKIDYVVNASNPEDALAKLCIELKKQGVLK